MGKAHPALWCPAISGPKPRLMTADGTPCAYGSEQRWITSAQVSQGARVSWAIVPDVSVLGSDAPGVTLTPSEQAAHRVRLARTLDAALTVATPSAPSLYRLIGADPSEPIASNIAVLDTTTGQPVDGNFLGAPASESHLIDIDETHILHVVGEDARTKPPQLDMLMLDGEVMIRAHECLGLQDLNVAYLTNRGPLQRYIDAANPQPVASLLQRTLGAHAQVGTVIGASAAASTALTVAATIGARRVVLLSGALLPGTPKPQATTTSILTQLANRGIRLELYVETVERTVVAGASSLRDVSVALATQMTTCGGVAAVHEFAGGHDLAAWFGVLEALRKDTHDNNS
ncbi:hypothetical protein [Corynebacterium cystitidis]|uniref:hypothetical protein n=1 Tax=Corynebacterium cystitidis TaxID=35757 RepID=UPI00211E0CDB|nr:hypothetical protein [Corynebacterium cystitidis]